MGRRVRKDIAAARERELIEALNFHAQIMDIQYRVEPAEDGKYWIRHIWFRGSTNWQELATLQIRGHNKDGSMRVTVRKRAGPYTRQWAPNWATPSDVIRAVEALVRDELAWDRTLTSGGKNARPND